MPNHDGSSGTKKFIMYRGLSESGNREKGGKKSPPKLGTLTEKTEQ